MVIPTIVATVVGGLTYAVTGKVTKRFFPKEETFEEKVEKKLVNKAFHVSRTSPFLESHFLEVDGEKFAYYETVYNLMKWINFRLNKPVYIDKTVCWYVVDCVWESKIEHHYDPEWLDGIQELSFRCKLPMESYSAEQVKSLDFNKLLETQAMIELWNMFRNKFPHILLHRARLGQNPEEHGLFGKTDRSLDGSSSENRPS